MAVWKMQIGSPEEAKEIETELAIVRRILLRRLRSASNEFKAAAEDEKARELMMVQEGARVTRAICKMGEEGIICPGALRVSGKPIFQQKRHLTPTLNILPEPLPFQKEK